MAVVGMTVEEREGAGDEVGEIEDETSVQAGGEETRGAVRVCGGEVSIVGGMLTSGKVEEVAMTAETV